MWPPHEVDRCAEAYLTDEKTKAQRGEALPKVAQESARTTALPLLPHRLSEVLTSPRVPGAIHHAGCMLGRACLSPTWPLRSLVTLSKSSSLKSELQFPHL